MSNGDPVGSPFIVDVVTHLHLSLDAIATRVLRIHRCNRDFRNTISVLFDQARNAGLFGACQYGREYQ